MVNDMDKKPILACKGQENGFTYKYTRTAYVAGFPIEFLTDLTEEEFERLLDGEGYTVEELERFETTGKF